MSDSKQVKVDNWGIYFLQRLKHFFNRTDYCDLTLQFQDNAQLKVHRLVLNACTEYFELLERTCEMYEDCLIMPDDLQAEVVVPIINFMYTGQLEFKIELLDKLFQTSQIMNMPVLSKLLDAQRHQSSRSSSRHVPSSSPQLKHSYGRPAKRSHSKAFEPPRPPEKKSSMIQRKSTTSEQSLIRPETVKVTEKPTTLTHVHDSSKVAIIQRKPVQKPLVFDPRPTRYEVPEELDPENIYEDSFHNISYESKPLQVHPETSKYYKTKIKKPEFGIFSEASSSRKLLADNAANDMVECRRITTNESLFEDNVGWTDDSNVYETTIVQRPQKKDFNELFDDPFEATGPKVTIEAKDSTQAATVDHAKIISEVLKKYPHLVNSNKNIKLKILDTSSKPERKMPKKRTDLKASFRDVKVKKEPNDEENTYQEVLDSKEAARLIALGAENIKGPWICLICGTPGKALHFSQYYNFRRHLTEVHREKALPNICEHCGLKSGKRNYMLHHMYTKHDIPPPPSHKFPKCNQCNYIALTEGFLVKHKITHQEHLEFRCNVCFAVFNSSGLLLQHIQSTGHKYSADRKPNLQCIYCLKVFLRENNLYAHLKTHHKFEAKRDGIVDDSDEEQQANHPLSVPIKYEPAPGSNYDSEEDTREIQYQVQPDGNIHVSNRSPMKQTILNAGIDSPNQLQKRVRTLNRRESGEIMGNEINLPETNTNVHEDIMSNVQEFVHENIDDTEEFYIPTVVEQLHEQNSYAEIQENVDQNIVQQTKRANNIEQPIEIVMSNEEDMIAHGQPVIFDADGNPTKTLAVLTTLDSAHPSGMIINPEEYSLNVSHAVDIKNSNIVVVYSHPMDNQKQSYIVNPQYAQSQIVTSQDIGSSFVSTSAVITPNFSTSAPIVSEQVEVQQTIEGSFEGNIQQDITTESAQIPQQTSEENDSDIITIPGSVHQHNVVELSDMQLATEHEQNMQIVTESTTQTFDQYPQSSISLVQNTEIVLNNEHVVVTVPHNTETLMDVDTSLNEVSTNLVEVNVSNEMQSSETNTFSTNEPTLEEELPAINITETEITAESICPDKIREISAESTIESESVISQEVEAPESPTFTQNDVEIPENVEDVGRPIVGDIIVPVNNKKPIQSLASEWSEDEEDIPVSENETVVQQINNEIVNSAEVEESIENIQQEMEKQDATSDQNIPENNIEINHVQNEQVKETLEMELGTPTAPQEKISSLLSDWNDNDSQEEQNGDQDDVSPQAAVVVIEVPTETQEDKVDNQENASDVENNGSRETELIIETTNAAEPKKAANIKSLVSDWDEEDEEDK